jgi:hypothetical protein
VCWVNFRSVLVLQNWTFKGMAENENAHKNVF